MTDRILVCNQNGDWWEHHELFGIRESELRAHLDKEDRETELGSLDKLDRIIIEHGIPLSIYELD